MFHHTYGVNAVAIDTNDIIKWMERLLEGYEDKPYGYIGSISSGDSMVSAFKMKGDIEFVIAKHYTEITLNNEDLKKDWQMYVRGVLD
jgi:hypothetical protein